MKKAIFLYTINFAAYINLAFATSFTVPLNTNYVDGSRLKLKAGDTVFIEAGKRRFLQLKNFSGDSSKYLIIINKGQVIIENNDFYGIKLHNCTFFRFTGTGHPEFKYGIKVAGTANGASGISVDGLSSDFEIDHVEIYNTGFAGIMCKTDPSCDSLSNRGFFTQKNISLHDNYIHDVKGEGFYIGHTFYSGYEKNKNCPGVTLYPHEVENAKVFNNIIENTGWDGIQIGSTKNALVFNNRILNAGIENIRSQNNGIQIGEGSSGYFYNNIIRNSNGNGIIIFANNNTVIYNNMIINSGSSSIFCDERDTTKKYYIAVLNNTFYRFKENGLKWYNEHSRNIFKNNIFISDNDNITYILFLPQTINYEEAENTFTSMIGMSGEESIEILSGFAIHNAGAEVSGFFENTDIIVSKRIGASLTSQTSAD